MSTVSSLIDFLSIFNCYLTSGTANNLHVLFRGAILTFRERTITACMAAAWPWVTKHWTVYENTIRIAKFNSLLLARCLFQCILSLIPKELPILFIIDESLVRRYGPYVSGIGMHRDSVRSSHANLVVTPGNKWVVLAVGIKLPFTTKRYFALPVLSLMYTSKKLAKRNKTGRLYHKHRTVGELAMLMLKIVARWAPKRPFLLVADGAYGTHEIADYLNERSRHLLLRYGVVVTRFRLDGTTFKKAPVIKKARVGRKPVKGKKLPSPAEIAQRKKTRWIMADVDWYGDSKRTIQYISRTGY